MYENEVEATPELFEEIPDAKRVEMAELTRLLIYGLVGQRRFGLMTYCNQLLLNEFGRGSLAPKGRQPYVSPGQSVAAEPRSAALGTRIHNYKAL